VSNILKKIKRSYNPERVTYDTKFLEINSATLEIALKI
jgi:hypothetical protein